MDTLLEHLRRIGKIVTPKKQAASRRNGKLGGRPRLKPNVQGSATIGRTISQDSATS